MWSSSTQWVRWSYACWMGVSWPVVSANLICGGGDRRQPVSAFLCVTLVRCSAVGQVTTRGHLECPL